jgi:uncharacterized protein (DUF4415 family)
MPLPTPDETIQPSPTSQDGIIRLSRDVLDHFKAKGQGWQSKMTPCERLRVSKSDPAIAASHPSASTVYP